jgi:heterodisulfide reductase subunit A-like polyferredoxin
MVRIFMLIVGGLYQLYPIPVGLLAGIFIAGAVQTPLEAVLCVLASTLVGVPALIAIEKGKMLRWPLS